MHYINELKDKKFHDHLIRYRNSFTKSLTFLVEDSIEETRNARGKPQHNKGVLQQASSQQQPQ